MLELGHGNWMHWLAPLPHLQDHTSEVGQGAVVPAPVHLGPSSPRFDVEAVQRWVDERREAG